jgi:outer membrane protein assembly factor BamD (BamD/ComL family)
LVLLLLIAGCATMQGRWKNVQEEDTIEAYEEILRRYPDAEFAPQAHARLESLYFKKANEINSIESYQEFLERYQEGSLADEARMKLKWLQTEQANTIEAYEEFLRLFPKGEQAEEARTRLKLLYFQEAKAKDTIESWESFLVRYSERGLADSARARVEQLHLEKAKVTNTIEAFEEFLKLYPEGKNAEEAQRCLEELRDQIKQVEEATKSVLPEGVDVEVTSVSQFPQKPRLLISAHLLEGHSADETNPYVRGPYSTRDKLTRLVRLRCAKILKSVVVQAQLPDASEITIQARHGVREVNLATGASSDVAKTLYEVSISLDKIKEHDWTTISLEKVMELWTVDENIIPYIDIRTVRG